MRRLWLIWLACVAMAMVGAVFYQLGAPLAGLGAFVAASVMLVWMLAEMVKGVGQVEE